MASKTTHEPQSNVARHSGIPISMFKHPDPLLFIPFILRPKIWHRGPCPKAHWYMCADYNHYNNSPLNSSDVPVTHNFSSTGLSSRTNCWSSSGLFNCYGVIQVASSTENPFHSTKNFFNYLFISFKLSATVGSFRFPSMAPRLQVHLPEKLAGPLCTSAAFQSLNKETWNTGWILQSSGKANLYACSPMVSITRKGPTNLF